MLTAWRRLVPAGTPRSIRVNLAIVLAFALVAVLMLTRTLVSAVRIDDDVHAAITPELTAIGTDTLHLPVLDRTRELVEAIEVAVAPLHPSLATTARLNADVAETLHDIRDNTVGIGESVSGIDTSVTSIRATLSGLAPAIASVKSQTGDITAALARAATLTEGVAADVLGIERKLGATAVDVGLVGGNVEQARDTLRAIDGHAANIEDSAVLAVADLLLRRPDLVQVGNIVPAGPPR